MDQFASRDLYKEETAPSGDTKESSSAQAMKSGHHAIK